MPDKLDVYDLVQGWKSIDGDEFFGQENYSVEEVLPTLGFLHFTHLGVEAIFAVAMYRHEDGRWFLTIDSPGAWHPVLATSFPAMLYVLERMQAYLLPGLAGQFMEMTEDLRELLTGENGPLWQAQVIRYREERARRKAMGG